ncbi:uncharacterized protein N7473_007568 [Penicillium subrubescens]|uniref:Uncharacterized protein n=1 Tax=Penicillium subrubescens TaxID=1316194 RepID=A0A1Q5UAK7_9EURO|nr:uncharacterized protein N7473_007568 [Penicillium subrubescens]KAJ5891340.1 hypothetical protein N7473_007568 [Penicillium subrubescens]OKP09508.1 hypothetical protein PENSUB_5130 [Penicillium subrubescens]
MFLKLLTSALLFSTFSNALAPVGLGTAAAYLVLGGQAVTNTGPTIVDSGGNLGVSPGTSVTNFPPGVVVPPGVIHIADASAAQAQLDLVTAYNDAAGRPSATLEPTDLGGLTLTSGVYQSVPGRGPMTITVGRTLTLDAQGDPNAVWIFQTDSSLITYSGSRVLLINGAQPCNVFWQVGSSATLGTTSTFVGTLMALSSISAQTNAVIQGRLLARNAQVSLDSNTITLPNCAIITSTTSTSTTSTSTTALSTTTTTTSTTTATGPIITLPIIGPIGPILGGGIGNGGGISGGIGNHNGGGGVGNGGGGIGNGGVGGDVGSGNGNGNGEGKGKEIGNGNSVPLPISEHNHYHDQGYDQYGAYGDHQYGAYGDHQYGANGDHYGANSDHYGANSDHYGADSDHYGADSGHYGANSDHYGADSGHYGAGSGHYGADSGHYGAGSGHYGADSDHYGADSDHYGADSDHQYDRTAKMEDVQEAIQHAQEAANLYNARH